MKKINLIGKSFLIWFISLNLCTILIALLISGIVISKNPNLTEVKIEDQSLKLIISILSTICGFYFFKKSMNEEIIIKKEKIKFKEIIKYSFILISIGNIGEYFVNSINKLINLMGYSFSKTSYNSMFVATNILDYVLIILSVVIIAPIVEELMYRLILNNSLKQYGKKVSLIISSLIFGIVHCNFYQILPAMGAGIILSIIYFKTNDIRYSIIVHMINNLTATLLMFFNINNDFLNFTLIICGLLISITNKKMFLIKLDSNDFNYKFLLKSFSLMIFFIICLIMTFTQLTKI